MKATVSFSEVSDEEVAHLRTRLADVKATAAADDPVQGFTDMEEVFAAQIVNEVAAYVERARSERVAAQAKLGEVFVALPEEAQAELRRKLIEAGKANGVDVSALEGES